MLKKSSVSTPTTILEMVASIAAKYPQAPAIGSPDRAKSPITYENLLKLIHHIHFQLRTLGIGSEDRIALVAPVNSVLTATASVAIAANTTCGLLNPHFSETEFCNYLQRLNPKALIVCDDSNHPELKLNATNAANSLKIPILKVEEDVKIADGWFSLQSDTQFLENCTSFPGEINDISADDIAFIFLTSGSTSQPKLVPATHRGLCFSCFNTQRVLELTPKDVNLNVLPMFHVHGLVTNVLLPLSAGSSVICAGEFVAETFLTCLTTLGVTWYSVGSPIHSLILEAILKNPLMNKPSALRFIRSGSAKLSPQTAIALESHLCVPMLEAYGMSEVLTATNTLLPPHPQKPGSVGPSVGTELGIMTATGELLGVGEQGEVVIRGVNVTPGYLDNKEANDLAFVSGWFHTGDLGYLDEDGFLFICGRIKELINRGGEKVAPQEVETALLGILGIKQAAVYGIPHKLLGEEVVAALVLHPNTKLSPALIRRQLLQKLAYFKVPTHLLTVDELPLTPSGKLDRKALPSLKAKSEPQEFVAPCNQYETKLAGIWSDILGVEKLSIHDNFFELGGNSLLATQVISRILQEFFIKISLKSFFENPTIADLSDHIKTLLWLQQGSEASAKHDEMEEIEL
ncbi:MAG: non-ribosomal peptide synthetase [Cyanobacteria bacterium P01_A01_bin.80]